jgi:hypothetical protein
MKKLDFVFVGLTLLAVVYIAFNWNSGDRPNHGRISSTATSTPYSTASSTPSSTISSSGKSDHNPDNSNNLGKQTGKTNGGVSSELELKNISTNFFDPVFGLRMRLPKNWQLDPDSNFSDGLTFRRVVDGNTTDLIYFTKPSTDSFTDPNKSNRSSTLQGFSETNGLKPAVVWFNGYIGEMCAALVTTRGQEGQVEFDKIMKTVKFEEPTVLVSK